MTLRMLKVLMHLKQPGQGFDSPKIILFFEGSWNLTRQMYKLDLDNSACDKYFREFLIAEVSAWRNTELEFLLYLA